MAKPILKKVSNLILMGKTAGKIYKAVNEEVERRRIIAYPLYRCTSLEQCVERARKVAKPGEIVLFSPASASFDMFKNFAERGNIFKNLVNNL